MIRGKSYVEQTAVASGKIRNCVDVLLALVCHSTADIRQRSGTDGNASNRTALAHFAGVKVGPAIGTGLIIAHICLLH